MCKHGNTIPLLVPVPAHLSHTGRLEWREKPVDRCIAALIARLNDAGSLTAGCCCGHGKEPGNVIFHNGSMLLICGDECKSGIREISGHSLHCPQCNEHLTSLFLCPGCGQRYLQLDDNGWKMTNYFDHIGTAQKLLEQQAEINQLRAELTRVGVERRQLGIALERLVRDIAEYCGDDDKMWFEDGLEMAREALEGDNQ